MQDSIEDNYQPPYPLIGLAQRLSPFWHDRLIEFALVSSMAFYYIIGNMHLESGYISHLSPLFALPFLLLFAVLSWYRLSFAVALLPLALPYYLLPKTVVSHYAFSLSEIALAVCLLVALMQLLLQRKQWHYWLSWETLRDRIGPFAIPMLVFLAVAVSSIFIAYDHVVALRALHEEVLEPLLYLVLALYCLCTRQDVMRLLSALLIMGFMVAVLGMVQYFFFRHLLKPESDGILRVHAMYGSANDIGLLFDYVLPLSFALFLFRPERGLLISWKYRIAAILLCIPLLLVLYLSQSRGAWVAITAAALFLIVCSIRHRKVVLISLLFLVLILSVGLFLFHAQISTLIIDGHTSVTGVSTVTKRLYLWQVALNMIHDSPWLGYGMNNWLCHYSSNNLCHTTALIQHYLIKRDPITHRLTGLSDEPTLSHPHNIFLHIWVSIGIFGLLAFLVLLGLFFWLFARIMRHLYILDSRERHHLQWMVLGVGAAMLAAIIQGQVDSSFLEQDLAFCFWMLFAALLLLRVLSGTSWMPQSAIRHCINE